MAQPSSNSPTDGHQYKKDQTDLEISENVAESERELIEGVVLHATDKNVVHFEDIKSDGGNVDQDDKSSEGNRDQDNKSDDGDGDQDNTSGGGNGDLDNRSDEENGDQDNKSGEGNGDQDNKSDEGFGDQVPSHLPTSITAIKVQPPSSYTKPLISGDSVANSAQWRCTSLSSSRPSMSTATPGSPQDDNIVYPQFQNVKNTKWTRKPEPRSVPVYSVQKIHDDSKDIPKQCSDDYALIGKQSM